MARPVMPSVVLMAQSVVDRSAIDRMLALIGAKPGWESDARPNAELLTEVAGKLCYLSFDTDLNKNLTRAGGKTNFDYIRGSILANGHGSVLEHSTATFAFLNVSRVFTHEVVRHRAGTAFSQVSGRYVRADKLSYYLPQAIIEAGLQTPFHDAFVSQERRHARMVADCGLEDMKDFKLKKIITSALRRILGNGQCNHILVTANHRAWRHMIELRTAPEAEEEIRLVFFEVFRTLAEEFPTIYSDAEIHAGENDQMPFGAVKFLNSKI